MAVISQSESNFKQRQRALSRRLDWGELQTSREIKAWITFSRLPRDKNRPHLFAGLNFSATERNKKDKLGFCSGSPSSNAITDWLAELKSIRCSTSRRNTETSDRKLFHTCRSSSVWCFQLQQKFKHICLGLFFFLGDMAACCPLCFTHDATQRQTDQIQVCWQLMQPGRLLLDFSILFPLSGDARTHLHVHHHVRWPPS